MASLSGVNRSNSNYLNNLMNSTNKISGLASGLDTEGMIQSLVQSYQTKINQFNQKITKLEWKQEAYRGIISGLHNFSNKYTSYTSSTNLMSKSFFTNSVNVSPLGKFADSVIASGKTNSNISLNAVHQLATTAQYRTSSNMASGGSSVSASEAVDLAATTTQSNLNGKMTLNYNGQDINISFDQKKDVELINEIKAEREAANQSTDDASLLAELINRKLREQPAPAAKNEEGEEVEEGEETKTYADLIEATVKDGKIVLSTKDGSEESSVSISKVTGNLAENLGIDLSSKKAEDSEDAQDGEEAKPVNSFGLKEKLRLTNEVANTSTSGKSMSITLNGVTKAITLPTLSKEKNDNGDEEVYIDLGNGKKEKYTAEKYTELLNKSVQDAFNGKVKVENASKDPNKLQLKFSVADKKDGSTLTIKSDAGKTLGLGETATNYLDTNKTLGELMGTDENGNLIGVTAVQEENEDGEKVDKVDENGNKLYEFKINDVVVGTYTKDTTLADVMNDINNSKAGVKVSYSKTTQNFLFETKDTGADVKIEFGDGLAKKMFGVDTSNSQKTRDYLGLAPGELKGQKFEITIDGDTENPFVYSFTGDDSNLGQMLKAINTGLEGRGLTAKIDSETGALYLQNSAGERVEYEANSDIASKLAKPKAEYTAGQDAIFDVTVNGEDLRMTRSSNVVDIDGLSITMKETFNSGGNRAEEGQSPQYDKVYQSSNSVTFKTSTDSDKIIDAIKSMISDYNSMMSDVKSAYSTMPYQSSNGSFTNYEPLTDDDMEGMSESAIARYEEKAKQGLLFGDQNLAGLYNGMLEAFSFNNPSDVATLREMGISVSYNINDGSQTVTLDEEKLRSMLDSDPDRVADLFTKSDGIMDRMKTQLDRYAKTTGEPKGILVQQSGTPLSALSLLSNGWQDEINRYNEQIEKWQTKLQSQVERYTSQFTRLETLINQMNSQSSALAGMMGG